MLLLAHIDNGDLGEQERECSGLHTASTSGALWNKHEFKEGADQYARLAAAAGR